MSLTVDKNSMLSLLKHQQESFKQAGYPDLELRIDRLDRLLAMIKKYDKQICNAIEEDFGARPHELSRLTEVFITIEHAKAAIVNVAEWMKPEKRNSPFPASEAGASSEVRYMPKGVVGIIGPWNFPVHLVLGPLVCVLAAGNRAMIKPSEITVNTARLIDEMIKEFFDPSEVTVVLGDQQVSKEFSQLPFDHIMFTGSTAVGRHIMRAAAENLTPVTLELGGKSPAVIDKDADLQTVASRLMTGKLFNSGQICVCPDYVFVPEDILNKLLSEMDNATKTLFPTIADKPEYTSIINDDHYSRLQDMVADASDRGIETITLNPANETFDEADNRKILPRIIINPSDDSLIMQSEIFGPLLPVKTYNHLSEVTEYISAHDHPLALYYFGNNEEHKTRLRDDILSGGMTINDVVVHVTCGELPFGGVGASGMGRYHGIDGFHEFSHLKAVYTQTPYEEIAGFMRPPYSEALRDMLDQQISEC